MKYAFSEIQKIQNWILIALMAGMIAPVLEHNVFIMGLISLIIVFVQYFLTIVNNRYSTWGTALFIGSLFFFNVSYLHYYPGNYFVHMIPSLLSIVLIGSLHSVPIYFYGTGSTLLYLISWGTLPLDTDLQMTHYSPVHAVFIVLFAGISGLLARRFRKFILLEEESVEVLDEKLEDVVIEKYEVPYLMFIKTIADRIFRVADTISTTSGRNIDRLIGEKEKVIKALAIGNAMRTSFIETEGNLHQTQEIIHTTLELAQSGESNVHEVLEMVKSMVKVVDITQKSIHDLGMAARKVENVIQLIDKISHQTRLLALNAAIEAARLGHSKETGFVMVAQEVKQLATLTQESVQDITNTVREIKKKTAIVGEVLKQEAGESLKGLDIARLGEQSIKYVVSILSSLKAEVDDISESFAENKEETIEIPRSFSMIDQFMRENEIRMKFLREKTQDMKTESNHILKLIKVEDISESLTAQNDKAYMLLNRFSLECERLFESAINAKEITEDALFNRNYERSETPDRFIAKYAELIKAKLQKIVDEYLEMDDHFLYFLLMDSGGFVPVCNSIYSEIEGTSSSDDLGIFKVSHVYSDYSTSAALRSEDIYLLQVISGNKEEPIMDMSVPLHFHDRSWGIVRVGYLYE
jgi:methyl-accepting chemotaxis protein